MKSAAFVLLAHSGVIDHVTIWRDPKHDGGWSVFAYPDEGATLSVSNEVEAARGGARTWASLDTAHAWIRSSGFAGNLNVDG